MALGFASWCFMEYRTQGNALYAVAGGAAAASGVALVYYGLRFARKLKRYRIPVVRSLSSILIGLMCALGYARPVWACATCFGAQDSPQTQGMNMAIFTLLGVTYALIGGMLTTALVLWRRNRTVSERADAEENAAPSPEFSDPELGRG